MVSYSRRPSSVVSTRTNVRGRAEEPSRPAGGSTRTSRGGSQLVTSGGSAIAASGKDRARFRAGPEEPGRAQVRPTDADRRRGARSAARDAGPGQGRHPAPLTREGLPESLDRRLGVEAAHAGLQRAARGPERVGDDSGLLRERSRRDRRVRDRRERRGDDLETTGRDTLALGAAEAVGSQSARAGARTRRRRRRRTRRGRRGAGAPAAGQRRRAASRGARRDTRRARCAGGSGWWRGTFPASLPRLGRPERGANRRAGPAEGQRPDGARPRARGPRRRRGRRTRASTCGRAAGVLRGGLPYARGELDEVMGVSRGVLEGAEEAEERADARVERLHRLEGVANPLGRDPRGVKRLPPRREEGGEVARGDAAAGDGFGGEGGPPPRRAGRTGRRTPTRAVASIRARAARPSRGPSRRRGRPAGRPGRRGPRGRRSVASGPRREERAADLLRPEQREAPAERRGPTRGPPRRPPSPERPGRGARAASRRRSATLTSWTSSSSPPACARAASARIRRACAGRASSRRPRIEPDRDDDTTDLRRQS